MVLFFSACKKDDEVGKSSIVVHAYGGLGLNGVVENGIVFTVPESQTVITDKNGIATITDLDAGDYDVYLIVEGLGSGKETVKLGENTSERLEIKCVWYSFPDFIPTISVLEPSKSNRDYLMGPNDTLTFLLKIENGIPGNKVIWTSDIDSIIGESTINADLTSSISFNGLTLGTHEVTIRAKSNGYGDGILRISLNTNGADRLRLYPLEIDKNKIKFTWSQYKGDDFRVYRIVEKRRSAENGEIIKRSLITFPNALDTSFALNIANEYDCEYYIEMGTFTDWVASESNSRIFNRNYFGSVFGRGCDRMVFHEYKNQVFLIYWDKVILYDYQNLEIVATIPIQNINDHFDVRYSGNEAILYFITDYQVYIVNASDLSVIKVIEHSNTLSSLVAISDDIIITSEYERYEISKIYSYSLSQSRVIDSLVMYYPNADRIYLSRNPVNNNIVVFVYNNERRLFLLDFQVNGRIDGLISTSSTLTGDYNIHTLVFSPDGDYFLPRGSSSTVYQMLDDEIITVGSLPNQYHLADVFFSLNSDTIYGFFKWRDSHEQKFRAYTYPQLEVVEYIELFNFHARVAKKGNTFYSLIKDRIYEVQDYYFIEGKPF